MGLEGVSRYEVFRVSKEGGWSSVKSITLKSVGESKPPQIVIEPSSRNEALLIWDILNLVKFGRMKAGRTWILNRQH